MVLTVKEVQWKEKGARGLRIQQKNIEIEHGVQTGKAKDEAN